MKTKMQSFKRTAYIAMAFVLAVAGVAQGLLTEKVHAFPTGGVLLNREVRISNSQPGATGTTYLVAFQPASTYAVHGIIVDFCGGLSSTNSGTPLINDPDCDLPTGFDIGTPTVVVTSVDDGESTFTDLGAGSGGSWVATDHFSNGQTLRLTHAGTGPTLTAGTKYKFAITGVTNPTPLESFYARIITYQLDDGEILTYDHDDAGDTDGDAEDYGGIALSTAYDINITARVQETLTFCVSSVNPDDNCSANVTAPDLTLGHGPNLILDASTHDTADAFIQASSNAQSGVVVRMKNTNTCGGLSRDGGTTCDIQPRGGTAGSIAFGSGTAYFGMFATQISGTNLDPIAPYNDGGSSNYGMDNGANGVSSTYGDVVTESTVPLSNEENQLTFAAIATNTTPAGLYTATIIMNATGTF